MISVYALMQPPNLYTDDRHGTWHRYGTLVKRSAVTERAGTTLPHWNRPGLRQGSIVGDPKSHMVVNKRYGQQTLATRCSG